MPTGVRGTTARRSVHQGPLSFRQRITFADATVRVGPFPTGALIDREQSSAFVIEPFNAATTNTLHVGTEADPDAYASALALGAVAQVKFDEFSAANLLTADGYLLLTYNQAGAAPTTGIADVVIVFHQDNDG